MPCVRGCVCVLVFLCRMLPVPGAACWAPTVCGRFLLCVPHCCALPLPLPLFHKLLLLANQCGLCAAFQALACWCNFPQPAGTHPCTHCPSLPPPSFSLLTSGRPFPPHVHACQARVLYVNPASKEVGLSLLPHLLDMRMPGPFPFMGQVGLNA